MVMELKRDNIQLTYTRGSQVGVPYPLSRAPLQTRDKTTLSERQIENNSTLEDLDLMTAQINFIREEMAKYQTLQ